MTAYNGAVAFAPAYIPALLRTIEHYTSGCCLIWKNTPWRSMARSTRSSTLTCRLRWQKRPNAEGTMYQRQRTRSGVMFGYGWWKHSPELAEKLLLKNGFTRGRDGKWLLPDGTPWKIEIVCLTAATNPRSSGRLPSPISGRPSVSTAKPFLLNSARR